MNSKHTPGPWVDTGGGWIEGVNGEAVIEYSGCGSHEANWESNYDKLLVLAAPELLENLIGCMEALASHVPDCIEVQCARAAIAKATGGAA